MPDRSDRTNTSYMSYPAYLSYSTDLSDLTDPTDIRTAREPRPLTLVRADCPLDRGSRERSPSQPGETPGSRDAGRTPALRAPEPPNKPEPLCYRPWLPRTGIGTTMPHGGGGGRRSDE